MILEWVEAKRSDSSSILLSCFSFLIELVVTYCNISFHSSQQFTNCDQHHTIHTNKFLLAMVSKYNEKLNKKFWFFIMYLLMIMVWFALSIWYWSIWECYMDYLKGREWFNCTYLGIIYTTLQRLMVFCSELSGSWFYIFF